MHHILDSAEATTKRFEYQSNEGGWPEYCKEFFFFFFFKTQFICDL
jgi:hypothetical protein